MFHSRVGGGHLSAARALVAELEASGRCAARLVDIYVDCGRFPVTLFPAVYAELARDHPRLWSLIYHGTERRGNPSRVVGPFVRTGLRHLLRDERPDLVVSVLPAVNGLKISSQSWRRGGLGSNALVTFTLRNDNNYAVKDIEIACAFSRQDGSHLTDRKRAIPDAVVSMKSRKTFAQMHIGFVNIYANKAKCVPIAANRI